MVNKIGHAVANSTTAAHSVLLSHANHPQLYPYQNDGVKFLLNNTRCLLADDPGLGKSCQSIVAAQENKFKNILVLCPKTLIPNWLNEIQIWDYPTTLRQGHWYVTNWDRLLTKEGDQLLKQKWDLIIGDECQVALKSWSAKRCKIFIQQLAKRAQNIWLLSATPSTKSAADYHPVLSLISPGKWEKFGDFQERYCKKKVVNYGKYSFGHKKTVYYGFEKAAELRERIRKEGKVLRRKKDEVLKDLPEKIYQTFYVETKKTIDDASVIKTLAIFYPGGDNLPPAIATLVRETGEAKVKAVADHALTFPDDIPLAIFCWHKSVAQKLHDEILKEKYCQVITGDTPADKRSLIIEQFQMNLTPVLIMNMQCGGVGLNLQNCSHCSFAELPWSAAMFEQCVDRFHRIGTKNAVNIYKFVAVNSIDEPIERVLLMKEKGMKEVMT